MAKIEKYRYPGEWDKKEDEDFMAWPDRVQKMLEKLIFTSNEIPEGQLVGVVVSFPVADGAAYYIVTNEKPLTVQWIRFLDSYEAPVPLIRGLNRNDIEQMHHRSKKLKELFDKKNVVV